MILEGKYLQTKGRMDGEMEITFEVANYYQREMNKKIKKERLYSIELKEIKDKRSIQQNRYMWALLKEIAEEVNGDYDDEQMYCHALELANIDAPIVLCDEKAEASLKMNYRVVKPMEFVTGKNGKVWRYYKLYKGSSHMDTKEMAVLIDTILDMAFRAGIDSEYWRGLLCDQ